MAKAEDTEIQRKELALVPGSMQEVYYAFLRGGMCSSYLAATVIASDMVATSQTGAMGTVGLFVNETCLGTHCYLVYALKGTGWI